MSMGDVQNYHVGKGVLRQYTKIAPKGDLSGRGKAKIEKKRGAIPRAIKRDNGEKRDVKEKRRDPVLTLKWPPCGPCEICPERTPFGGPLRGGGSLKCSARRLLEQRVDPKQ